MAVLGRYLVCIGAFIWKRGQTLQAACQSRSRGDRVRVFPALDQVDA